MGNWKKKKGSWEIGELEKKGNLGNWDKGKLRKGGFGEIGN